jgi:tRNA(Arg) A34 adenosine deaminase TadA
MPTETHGEMKFMRMALDLATENVVSGAGGPFGAVIVRDGVVIARAANRVTSDNDPTAHAEVLAIRAACKQVQSFQLDGCELYTSCEPCPMCLGAIYWARLSAIYFANTQHEAAEAGFDDAFIYREIDLPAAQRSIPMRQLAPENFVECFDRWRASNARVDY